MSDQEELALEPTDDPRRMLDDLISRALAYRTGGELKELFDFMRRFPHFAPYNAMLLHVQNAGVGYALRAAVWEKKYKRRVRPAARPYVVLRTMGPVSFVFDLSDTEPIDPSIDLVPEIVKNPFPTKGQPPPKALKNLKAACSKLGIEIEFRDRGTVLAGCVQRINNRKPPFHITLNSKHDEAQKLGTLAHELGHVFCGHLGSTKNGFWPERKGQSLQIREFEAEAVAYLFTDRHDLDIGSVQYLAEYLKDRQQLPNYSLDAILKAVGKIEQMVSGKFRLKTKPKKQERLGKPPIAIPPPVVGETSNQRVNA